MDKLNSWSDAFILTWLGGALALVIVFFIFFDAYRMRRRIQRYGKLERRPEPVPGAGQFEVIRNVVPAAQEAARIRNERRETLLELHRRYEESHRLLLRRQQEIDTLAKRFLDRGINAPQVMPLDQTESP